MVDIIPKIGEGTFEDIIRKKSTKVSDVGVVVDCGATGVHGDGLGEDGCEGVLGSREGVVERYRAGGWGCGRGGLFFISCGAG